MTPHIKYRSSLFLVLPLAAMLLPSAIRPSPAQTRRPTQRPAQRPAGTAPAAAPEVRYKGIWEPVSYPADLMLLSVFFATPQEGWAAGGSNERNATGAVTKGGIILHTSDGGDHWDVQYGDPESSERPVEELRFLDVTHGWAVQACEHLLHTRDGQNWIRAGTIACYNRDYMFTSETTGVELAGGRGNADDISVTRDGGRTWEPVFNCATTIQAGGLAHNVKCQFTRLQFLNPNVGYAVGFSFDSGAEGSIFLVKTTDGGASWNWVNAVQVMDKGQASDLFFIDESTGYVRVGYPDSGQLFKTTDGGKTWTGMAASPGTRIQFADPEVGWAVLSNTGLFTSARVKVSFTTDAGQRWNSREYPFPAKVSAFSLPRRDRGYVVGEHGMIMRYRIVPEEYTNPKGMIPAPLLSGINSPLDNEVQTLAAQVQHLAAEVGVPVSAVSGEGAAAAPSDTTGGAAAATGAPSGPTSAAPAPAAGAPAAGDFTQNIDATVNSPAFSQDVTKVEGTLGSVAGDAQQFANKYRSLNLMAGFQAATQLPGQAQELKESFAQLKQIKDGKSATAALTNIYSRVQSLMQSTRTAYLRK